MQCRYWWGVGLIAVMALTGGACGNSDGGVQATGPSTSSGAPGEADKGNQPGALIGSLTPEASTDFLTQVALQTSAKQTGRFSMTVTVDGAKGTNGTVKLVELSGAYDKNAGTSHIKLDTSGAAGSGTSSYLDPSTGVDPAMLTGSIEVINDGKNQYVKVPGLSGVLGSSGSWIKSSEDGSGMAGFQQVLDLFNVEDISGFLETLQASGTVEEQGKEQLDGVSTIHYRAKVDPTKIDTSKSESAGKLLISFGDAKEAVVDVWVDGEGLFHKLAIVADAGALGSDLAKTYAGGTATLTMSLADLGQTVEIKAPPESEILDLGQLEAGGLDPNGLLGGGDPFSGLGL